ncbi:MAG: patatin-like phospholipase RssA [Plesiomonas sp.]
MEKIKIGIALGAGAAKGWAHIGVLKALSDCGIEADIVVGTSIGAFVGAAYANNRLSELETWVKDFSYWDVIRLMDFEWGKGGLIRGERVFDIAAAKIGKKNIEDCIKPFAVVATELETGRERWLMKGDLQQAVRASCSMPGLLAPMQLDGQWMVDGAVVNPVPISLAKAMGADFVIAVDLGREHQMAKIDMLSAYPIELTQTEDESWQAKLRHKIEKILPQKRNDNVPSALDVMTSSMQILESRLKKSRMAGDPPDVLIQPNVTQISTLDFHHAAAAIDAGYRAVERVSEQLEPIVAFLQLRDEK